MGKTLKPLPVKLIAGLIAAQPEHFEPVRRKLIRRYGEIDYTSDCLIFDATDYYEEEFGKNLFRQFLSFKKLLAPHRITDIKRHTNCLESRYRGPSKKRTVNIDPGYLSLSKLVLATTKNFAHRIYINKGIFGEITLFYKKDSFRPDRWTYPDYRQTSHIEIFNKIRDHYYQQLVDEYGLSQLHRSV